MESVERVFSNSVEDTEACGRRLAETLLKDEALPSFVALRGDLGVGKTAFVRGFVSAVSPAAFVRSPTFALVNEYKASPRPVYHFDLYRIEDEDDLSSIGYDDYIEKRAFCLVEWSEKIPDALPRHRLTVTIEKDDAANPSHRRITIEGLGAQTI